MSELINYIDMTPERLDERGKILSEKIRDGYLTPERKAQVQKELGDISFELWCRYQENEVEFIPIV